MTIKPIAPDEVVKHKITTFPDWVVKTWNDLIAKHYNYGCARVFQNVAIEALEAAAPDAFKSGEQSVRSKIFKEGLLDVEDMYREQGWTVDYDKPAYNESYEASFTFEKK